MVELAGTMFIPRLGAVAQRPVCFVYMSQLQYMHPRLRSDVVSWRCLYVCCFFFLNLINANLIHVNESNIIANLY